MNWREFTTEEGLEEIKKRSNEMPQVIFKHSTRCSISTMAKSRLERSEVPNGIEFNYLDLIAHRNVSSKIADVFANIKILSKKIKPTKILSTLNNKIINKKIRK